jgi:hypothetical protein
MLCRKKESSCASNAKWCFCSQLLPRYRQHIKTMPGDALPKGTRHEALDIKKQDLTIGNSVSPQEVPSPASSQNLSFGHLLEMLCFRTCVQTPPQSADIRWPSISRVVCQDVKRSRWIHISIGNPPVYSSAPSKVADAHQIWVCQVSSLELCIVLIMERPSF